MTRVGVVGLGVGEAHARAFVESGCALAAVYDLDQAKSERLVAALGHGEVARSYDAILADPTIDVVVLATYDDDHADGIVRALGAGKHVFCEKPLVTNAADLARVEAAWRKCGRHLASNVVLRSAPLYQTLRERVRAGDLGDIYAFYGDYLYGRLEKITEGWRAGVENYSVMLGGGVHLVDLLFWTTGARPTRVHSTGNRIATEGTRFRYRDFVTSTFDCESGLVGVISANFGCVHRHQHVVRVFGTKGTFLYDDQGARIYCERDPGGPPEILTANPLPPSKGALVPEFLDALRDPDRRRERTTLDFRVLRACLAADAALKERPFTPIEPT